ncbi:MAG: hypothetical protein WDO18_10900 [Acidobacteriota bacterium]
MPRVSVSGESATAGSQWTQLYLGLGFTTLATLLLELSLTRLFSVVFFYHFAFLAISLALFGFGAGGVFSYVVASRPGNLSAELGRLTFVNSVAVVLLLWFILSRHGDMTFGTLAAVYIASSVPFFFAGTVVSLAISEAIGRIDRAYLFDLMGAAAGCLLLVPFLDYFGGPNTVLCRRCHLCCRVVHLVQSSRTSPPAGLRRPRRAAAGHADDHERHRPHLRRALGERRPHSRGTPRQVEQFFARGPYLRQDRNGRLLGYPHRRRRGHRRPPKSIGTSRSRRPPNRICCITARDSPYLLRPAAKTLIIGAGGGYDLARALGSGSKDVTGVEINPIIANDIMRGAMRKESFNLYRRPEVRIFVEDGRSFIRASHEKYQVLQATLVDTWASTAAGAFALSENNLYTADAFEDYLSHLTGDGVLAFSRWGFDPPRESLRVVSLGMEALRRLGETDAAKHVIVVRERARDINGWGALDTLLISRKPFTNADIEHAGHMAAQAGLDVLYLPGGGATNPFGQLLTAPDPQKFFASYAYDVSPVFDDRPFFFYTVQTRDLWNYLSNANPESADYKVNRAVPLLFGLMALCLAATALVMVLPRLVLGSRLPKQKGILTFLLYFICLGAGYILVQMALIQKFMLLLGQPTRALTVIVFSMLIASGAGSYFSGKWIDSSDRRLTFVLATVAALIAALAILATPLVHAAAVWPMPARILMTVAAIFPAAFFMGMPFPQRPPPPRTPPSTLRALGLVAERRRQRHGIGRRRRARHLLGLARDPPHRRSALYRRAPRHPRHPAHPSHRMKLIAIGGCSGAGKSTLAHAVACHLPSSAVIALDAYYANRGPVANYDHPDALDWPLIAEHLDALAQGRAVAIPVYDFERHSRTGNTFWIEPADFIVMEGILALHAPIIQARANLRVFIEAENAALLRPPPGPRYRRTRTHPRQHRRTVHELHAAYGPRVRAPQPRRRRRHRQWSAPR